MNRSHQLQENQLHINNGVSIQEEQVKKLKENILSQTQAICFEIKNIANAEQMDPSDFDDFKCQICLSEVVNNPVQCNQCHNIFGFQCAQRLFELDIEQYPQCPVCKKQWQSPIQDLKNRWIKNQIAKQFKIKCRNEENGCKTITPCQEQEIQQHENNCEYGLIKCNQSNLGCDWKGLRKDLKKHEQLKCQYLEIECEQCKNNPNEETYMYQRRECHKKKCQNKLIKCKYCKEQFPKKLLQDHEETQCKKRQFQCKMCSKQFNYNDYQTHLYQKNCYQKGKESQMFDKVLDIVQNQQKHLQKLEQKLEQQEKQIQEQNMYKQVIENKMHLMTKYMQYMGDSQNKEGFIQDFLQGIFHVNSLQMGLEILEGGLEINSIIINETDFGKFRRSMKSNLDFTNLINKIKYLALQKNDVWTQFTLAFLYYYGDKQIQIDYEQAFKLCQKLVEQNHAGGYWIMAKLFQIGDYVEQDEVMALTLYKKCDQLNFAPGINMLGFCYCNGIGVEKDERKGMMYYQKNAQLGFYTSLFNLGCIYFNEEIVEKNEILGFQFFLKAAEKGCVNAMKEVAGCLREGEGVEKNVLLSQFWEYKAKEFEEQYS